MKILLYKIIRLLCLYIINNFLCTTNFFALKKALLKIAGIEVGLNSRIVGPLYIGTVANLKIGKNCWIGSGLKLYGNGNVVIGNNCDVAPDLMFLTGSHEIGDSKRRAGSGVEYNIFIKDGCWIGARVTITGNTTISSGSIIGTCSLVNKDIVANVVAAGYPVKILKTLEL